MKRQYGFQVALLFTGMLVLLLTSALAWAGDSAKDVHPELDEQEKFIACADCHRDVTPDLEEEWYESVHGIAMVKCYQCHGTFETFKVSPGESNCATCHADQIGKKIAQGQKCWECHVPHTFTIE